ncbi:MAG: hypothetical protein QNK42_06110 [Pseudodonghicola sp.]|nr:hypothetical protein [Pseudodonghicola sp.]
MAQHDLNFSRRVDRLDRKHSAMLRGHDIVQRPDGLLVEAPIRRRRSWPARLLVLIVVLFVVFKALLFVSVGGATYEDRVARLQSGTKVEAMGAWLMQADPLTRGLAAQIADLMR